MIALQVAAVLQANGRTGAEIGIESQAWNAKLCSWTVSQR
jgi:hypothetical protein